MEREAEDYELFEESEWDVLGAFSVSCAWRDFGLLESSGLVV